jgi:peptidoglycan hydrolase-like protein with peptidoglycan-binding domain
MTPLLDRLVLRAAVSGPFRPDDILASLPETDRVAAAGELSLLCDEEASNGALLWRLRAGPRRDRLARLTSTEEARSAVAEAPNTGDLFARTLQAALCGTYRPERAGKGRRRSREGLLAETEADAAVLSALQLAGAAPYLDDSLRLQWQTAANDRIAARESRIAIATVLPERLVGRDRQLARLRAHAFAPRPDDPRPLLVTGLGGIGKSALVAALLQSLDRHGAVVIDFDRADLGSGEQLPILRELLRQVEPVWRRLGETGPAQTAGDLRSQMRRSETFGPLVSRTVEQQQSFLVSIAYPALKGLPDQLRSRPLAVIFDSFEVLAPDDANQALQFLADLGGEDLLPGIRPIVVARESPIAEADGTNPETGKPVPGARARFGPDKRRLQLDGLGAVSGARLLELHDAESRFADPALRLRASRALKGHPLALLVLERFARSESDRDVEALLADIEQGGSFSAELAHVFLYNRVLERIRDPAVRSLAHPGLVLREVRPDLIRLLLAKPCGLGVLTPTEASELFDRLGRQYWLVESVGPDSLRHRPDLRRMMLPGMFAGARPRDGAAETARKNDLQAKSREVARAAEAFWRDGPPAGDPAEAIFAARPPEDRRIEALYYGALAGNPAPDTLDQAEARRITERLGGDVDTLNLYWRAEIKAGSGRHRELTPEELDALSLKSREIAEQALSERSLRKGDAAAASRRLASEARRRALQKAIADMQEKLRALNLYAGRIDGVVGPKTRAAIDLLTRQAGLTFDSAALESLGPDLPDAVQGALDELFRKVPAAPEPEPEPESRADPAAQADLPPARDAAPAEQVPVDLDLVDRRLRSAIAIGDVLGPAKMGAGPAADARALLSALHEGVLPSAVDQDASAGRLWSTSLWQGSLALTRLGRVARPADAAERHASQTASFPAHVLLARLLVDRLVASAAQRRRPVGSVSDLLPRFDFRLQGVDGLRAAALALQEGEGRGEILLDVGSFSLLAPDGPREITVPQRYPDRDAPLQQPPLRFLDEAVPEQLRALQAGTRQAADFERLWTSGATAVLSLELARRLPNMVLAALRGLTPELHASAAEALNAIGRKAPQTAAKLVTALGADSSGWPMDLRPVDGEPWDERLALPIVLTADRVGHLRPLLQAMAGVNRQIEGLVKAHDRISDAFFSAAPAPKQKGRSK